MGTKGIDGNHEVEDMSCLAYGKNNAKIKTNVGTMPLDDYRDIHATQYGFDGYEDLRAQGYAMHIAFSDLRF